VGETFLNFLALFTHCSLLFLTRTCRDLDFILSLGGLVDWVALSFVQKPSDMEEFRQLAGDKIKLMAKLEKPSAIDSLEEVRCCGGLCQRCRAVLWSPVYVMMCICWRCCTRWVRVGSVGLP
jgi:hypothetical protein